MSRQPAENRGIDPKYQVLLDHLRSRERVLVAFSGGVDSTFLLKASVEALGSRARGVLGISPSLQTGNRERAHRLAESMGTELIEVATAEFENPEYLANSPDRCFHCKNNLFATLANLANGSGEVMLDGTNADDLRDDRPGRRAARIHGVESPLAELGWSKAEIRRVSETLGLETWDRPASPCLSSRIPHGTPVTIGALRRVEAAEQTLNSLGFQVVRVRDHGDLARIEVASDRIGDLVARKAEVSKALLELGYRQVTVDLMGYRLGGASGGPSDGSEPQTRRG